MNEQFSGLASLILILFFFFLKDISVEVAVLSGIVGIVWLSIQTVKTLKNWKKDNEKRREELEKTKEEREKIKEEREKMRKENELLDLQIEKAKRDKLKN